MASAESRVVVVGGCGHVGLPLALALARAGVDTSSYDINAQVVETVSAGQMPFDEPQGPEVLTEVLASGKFTATADPSVIESADAVIVVVGTPVDEHLNPDAHAVPDAIEGLAHHLKDGQLLVLRSTVFPGVTKLVEERLVSLGLDIDVVFCPERIAEGKAFTELYDLPQIVSGRTKAGTDRATELFGHLTGEIVETSPEEAELAKLFTNTWRYIKFAAANQFYMIANSHGIDFENVRAAITHEYPRAQDMPGAGFAAGPCLFKDTMQLAAFNNNTFFLGHAAMMVNEGLPMYVVDRMDERFDIKGKSVAILGMAFKGESDDIRSSLSFKLRRILKFRAREVLCSDPYVRDDDRLIDEASAVAQADVIVIGAPHARYGSLKTDKPIVDIWNIIGSGVLL